MKKKFTQTHEWVEIEGEMATIGITDYAQGELGDLVYVELPKVGSYLIQGREACVLESTKSAADVYAPVSGEVVLVNERLHQEIELVNGDAQGEGWLFRLRLSHPQEVEQLMEEEQYLAMVGKGS